MFSLNLFSSNTAPIFDSSWGLLFAGILLLMGLYHMILFAYRPQKSANLIFALLTFVGVYRLLATDAFLFSLIQNISWDIWFRMDHASNGLIFSLLYLFVRHSISQYYSQTMCNVAVSISLIYALSSAIIPLEYLDLLLQYFSILSLFTLYYLFKSELLALRQNTTAPHALLLITSAFFVLTLINDILYTLQLIRTDYLAPYGLIPLVIGHWLSLAREYGHSYTLAEQRLDEFMHAMAKTISSKSLYTGEHIERVTQISMRMARALRLPTAQQRQLFLGAMAHDLGKIHLPDDILDKPSELTPEELEKVRSHPAKGFEMLNKVKGLTIPRLIIRHHHEKWDGTGYPDQLAGKRIPLEARIVALADQWDAITSPRAHREATPVEQACKMLQNEAGKGLDPHLVSLFLSKKIWQES